MSGGHYTKLIKHPSIARLTARWVENAHLQNVRCNHIPWTVGATLHKKYTVSQKTVIIFGRKMAKKLKLCEVHALSTSPNSRRHTAVLNADVPNCYTTL